ncbi:hypothetical protein CONLIGDRAFT_684123 [Coniochaeta ligniaria NRRL 30616]|uniref:Phospholipase A2 n=1 Tax=Coniochaeta ligniaria NRRL 30616 TaxID=1408157 RepID=A0A1J7IWW1_9PEZI|nr:hypothetical protein CONLIGDRAFT_684123 [Coniochaeta ligniaria NRRL 30616]
MKFFLLTAVLARGALVAAAAARCGGDNCGRAVRATQYGPATSAARLFACNTYLQVTVTPEASTVYITMTDSTTITLGASQATDSPQSSSAVQKRQEHPAVERRQAPGTTKKIPAYASPCSSAAAYSSACSCFGAVASTVTEDPDTVTSVVTVTSTRTVQDSPPRTPVSGSVTETPPSDFTATYTWEEATLPTFDTMTQPIPMPTAAHVEPKCMIETADLTNTEFYLIDQTVGYLFNRGDRPGPPVAPTTEEEARILSDPANFHPPVYRFEKPSGSPAGLYDLVLVDSTANKKLYIAMRGTAGEVIFTDASTNGAVKGRLLTTMFGVTCKGYLIAKQGDIIYNWKALDDSTGTKLTTAASAQQANDTIVLLPKAVMDAKLERRSYATQDPPPRCLSNETIHYPVEVIAQLKRGARGNNPNGCGPNNGMDWVPDWSFGRCCDAHDNCYDDCGQAYGQCNLNFYNCMHGKCGELTDIWNFWLRPACEGMAAFYYSVVQLGGQDAFNQANKERCECVCPNTSQGLSQSLCQTTKPDANCLVTGGDDNENCGGCGWECPSRTHCSRGNCACDGDTCGNLCLNLLTHPRNCGSCGNVCKSGYCWQGACYDPPAVPDVCYPVDGITNGDFSQSTAGWSVGYPAFGSIMAYAMPGSSGATILFTLTAGTASFSQDVKMCEGTDYELDFSATRQAASHSCSYTITLAGLSVASRSFTNAALTKLAYGPFRVPTLQEGAAQTYKNGVYLYAPLILS